MINRIITALTFIVPGLLVFEISYSRGYFTDLPESFTFPALFFHVLWSIALSLPFHFFSWLFLRPVRNVKAADVPGIKAVFVAILIGIFYVFEELLYHGYIDVHMPHNDPDYSEGYLALTLLFTAVIAFPLGILYARLVGWVISRQERSIGEER
jgi:hypothetical protein